MNTHSPVICRVASLSIPTYPEPEKERLPMYCENRVHQRTSGQVYPNPIINEVVRDRKEDRAYTAIYLENEFIELILLPELGGRIFSARDKINDYHFFYRQHVIKPALIGLLGSWISGGAEFNWPLHHRPSTYLPTDYQIENEADGSVTVWMSEHEPLDRMKGMVGIRLAPGQARLETRVRLYNRTPETHSFLWWENIAVPVNEHYQIFFPDDVNHVHFHYKKSVTAYPVANSMYNGIDYRDGTKDVRWHKNTRNATSYFSARSAYDFFGGFDHDRQAGVVHVANHHLSPGKKLFTWAYNQLSRSWENALTDSDGAYAELMAGVYTDNQPDFTWIEPFEMKEFSQYWYPIRDIGAPRVANTRAALAFGVEADRLTLRLYAVENLCGARLRITHHGRELYTEILNVEAGRSFVTHCAAPGDEQNLAIEIISATGESLLAYRSTSPSAAPLPAPQEPVLPPHRMDRPCELYLAGIHLKQYREPLVNPEAYWKRAIEIDPDHYPSLTALGRQALHDARLVEAKQWFLRALKAQTRFNPNPQDDNALFHLGIVCRHLGENREAYDYFYRALWNFKWRSAAYFSLAQMDCAAGDLPKAREHLGLALQTNDRLLDARNLLAAVERLEGCSDRAVALARETLRLDPVNYGARIELALCGELAWPDLLQTLNSDPSQTWLDCLVEKSTAGLHRDALAMTTAFLKHFEKAPVSPMVRYFHASSLEKTGENEAAQREYLAATQANPDYCFPSRIEEMQLLQQRLQSANEARTAYYLGTLLYGKKQHDAGRDAWERARQDGENYYALHRNLAVAYYNQSKRDGAAARNSLELAMKQRPNDPQLLFEWNYLAQLLNVPAAERLKKLEAHRELVLRRDDLFAELVRAHNQLGRYKEAIALLAEHVFTPCEGGEHALVELWIVAHLGCGRHAMRAGDAITARDYFKAAQVFPANLGAGIWNIAMNVPAMTWEARAESALGNALAAEKIWKFIAEMGRDSFSYMYQPSLDCYRAQALLALGDKTEARTLLETCRREWSTALKEPDYGPFRPTPFFLSYLEKSNEMRSLHYHYLLGLVCLGLGEQSEALREFDSVLELNVGHLWSQLERNDLG